MEIIWNFLRDWFFGKYRAFHPRDRVHYCPKCGNRVGRMITDLDITYNRQTGKVIGITVETAYEGCNRHCEGMLKETDRGRNYSYYHYEVLPHKVEDFMRVYTFLNQ